MEPNDGVDIPSFLSPPLHCSLSVRKEAKDLERAILDQLTTSSLHDDGVTQYCSIHTNIKTLV